LIFQKLFPLLLVTAVGVWSVWPVVINPATVADYGTDGELIAWITNQTITKLHSGFDSGNKNGLFDGNIFYPYRNVMAYSEMFFISALFAFLPVILSGNRLITPGVTMLTGQVLTMIITYLFWIRLAKTSRWGTVAGTIVFGLSQIRWHYQVHLQMWSMQYWLTGSWLLCSWIEDKKNWKLFLGAGILGAQIWESILPVYFSLVLVGTYMMFNLHRSMFKLYISNRKRIAMAGFLFAAISFLPLRAYMTVSRETGFQRTIRDAAHGGLNVNDVWGVFWSPGLYVLLGAAVFKIFNQIQKSKKIKMNKNIKWLGAVAVISLIMAMGPVLKWNEKTVKIAGKLPVPLPYAAVYYLVPGMEAFRVPSRWIWLFGWAASGIIALGFSHLPFNHLSFKDKRLIGIAGAIFVAVTGGTRLINYRELPDIKNPPPVYAWLKNQPGEVILELPAADENLETGRMLYSLEHGKKLINGYSGFMPKEREKLLTGLNREYPSAELDNELKKTGVDYVIIHTDEFSNRQLMEGLWENRIIWKDEKTMVVGY